MADPLITRAELETRLGRTVDDNDQADAVIDDVSALVREIAGWSDTEPDTVPASVTAVMVGIVRRSLENPLGYKSETIGNWTWRDDGQTSIFATRQETKAIRRAAGKLAVGTADLDSHLPLPRDRHVGVFTVDDNLDEIA